MARADASRTSGWVDFLRLARDAAVFRRVDGHTWTSGKTRRPPERPGGSLTRTTAPVKATVIRFHRCESQAVSQGAYMVGVPYEEGGDAGGLD